MNDPTDIIGNAPEHVYDALAYKLRQEGNSAASQAELNRQAISLSKIDLRLKKNLESHTFSADEFYHVFRFFGPVSDTSMSLLMERFTHWHRIAESPINAELVIYSPGGNIVSGNVIYDFLQEFKSWGHHLTTTAFGYAASMGGIVLQAGDERRMGSEAWILIHEGADGAIGTVGEIEDKVAWSKGLRKRLSAILAERSTFTQRQIENKWKRTDWWINSADALKYGFIDKIV